MKVHEEEVSGFITCARDRMEFGDCRGYESQPVRLKRETVVRLYGDEHGDWSDPYARAESNSFQYLHTLDGSPPTCRHCGALASLSLEPRPTYRRSPGQGPGPDQLVHQMALERAEAQRAQAALDAAQRTAVAQERQAEAAEATATGTVQLHEAMRRQQVELDRLREQLALVGDGNGKAAETAKPRKRTEA